MTSTHDTVAAHIARTRFPFPGQTTWPGDYLTIVNVPTPQRSIQTPAGEHFPDIHIINTAGETREIGEVEMTVDPAALPYLRAGSEATDNLTPTGVKHFFLYVPAGQEVAAQSLLETNQISYAGIRTFTITPEGAVTITPAVTKGSQYDHQ